LRRSDGGLPSGVQIIGPYLEDRTTIRVAELIERETGGFIAPPETRFSPSADNVGYPGTKQECAGAGQHFRGQFHIHRE
jgi:hypothetical protein